MNSLSHILHVLPISFSFDLKFDAGVKRSVSRRFLFWSGWAENEVCSAGVRGDAGRGRCVQALPVGAVCVRQGAHVPRVAAHKDCERWARQLLCAQIRAHAGAHALSNARGHCCQPCEPRRDRPDSQTISVSGLIAVSEITVSLWCAKNVFSNNLVKLRLIFCYSINVSDVNSIFLVNF